VPVPPLRYLIYFVTSRCNLRCAHCFYLDELGPSDELTLDEIEKTCRQIKHLTFLRLTGGEPFLRKDLAEVITLFHTITGTRRMGIITNGTRHEQVRKVLAQLADAHMRSPLHLDIGVSIDDLGVEHDALRRKKGVFEAALQQISDLLEIQKQWKHLEVSVVVTATGANTSRLREIYDYLHDLGINRISCNLVRGSVADEQLTEVDLKAYTEFLKWTDEYNRIHHHGFDAILRRAKNQVGRKAIQVIHEAPSGNRKGKVTLPLQLGKAAPIHCQAGRAIAVLQPEGDVHLCEVLPIPLGNLREVDFDWKAIWEGERAAQARQMIDNTGCSCTHECFLTASILFGNSHYPQLAKAAVKEALATWQQR
jgi:MoaA/NifB/PqqE/SkfB family radical SAM enzyme